MLGTSAGLFDVPLTAYMQHRSPPQQRGAILAACNFLTFAGMLLSAGVYYLLRAPSGAGGTPLFSARQIFLLAGLFTIPVFLYIVCLLPQASIRFLVWLASQTIYRVRVYGRENLPEHGGALLVANHVTWIDGVLLLDGLQPADPHGGSCGLHSSWPVRWLARMWGVIPIDAGRSNRYAIRCRRPAQALRDGELVCIFPEGAPHPHRPGAGLQAGPAVVGRGNRRARDSGLPR